MADGGKKELTSSNSLYLKRSKFSARRPEADHTVSRGRHDSKFAEQKEGNHQGRSSDERQAQSSLQCASVKLGLFV